MNIIQNPQTIKTNDLQNYREILKCKKTLTSVYCFGK